MASSHHHHGAWRRKAAAWAYAIALLDLAAEGQAHSWERVKQQNLASHGRWAVSGAVDVGGLSSEAQLQSLIGTAKPEGGLTAYHHVRTQFPTVLYPHNADEFLGNHTIEGAPGSWCDERQCCAPNRTSWTVYAEFGTEQEALQFQEYLEGKLLPGIRDTKGLCMRSTAELKKLQCTTKTVHAKLRVCTPSASALREFLSGAKVLGDRGLWDQVSESFPSMRRPINLKDLVHRIYELEGAFTTDSCPAVLDKASGMYKADTRGHDCCCMHPMDWEVEAEFEDADEARAFLKFLKTSVTRALTTKGEMCTKMLNQDIDVSDHIFTSDINVRMCSRLWPEDLVDQLRELVTVAPFSFLGYARYAFPSIQSPLSEQELVDSNALLELRGETWCSDRNKECCCENQFQWHVQGRFLDRRHAQDFLYHVTDAIPRQIMRQIGGSCAAPTYAALHDLGCGTEEDVGLHDGLEEEELDEADAQEQ